MPPALTQITGSLYDSRGVKRTSGRLLIQPQTFVINGDHLVSANRVVVAIPSSGDLSFYLVPSNGIPYIVKFDPTPEDTVTPVELKEGYYKDEWLVPGSSGEIESMGSSGSNVVSIETL